MKYGGNPRVIVADPEVKAFKVTSNYDFVLLACKPLMLSHADTR